MREGCTRVHEGCEALPRAPTGGCEALPRAPPKTLFGKRVFGISKSFSCGRHGVERAVRHRQRRFSVRKRVFGMFSRGVGGWEVGWRGQCWFAVSEGEEFFARGLLWVCEWIDFRLICGGMRGRFFAPFAEICGNIAEAHSSRFPTFLSGERKVYKRSAFSAPRAFRRGDAFRKAADGFRRIAERFVRDDASSCSRRLSVAHERSSFAPLGARLKCCGSAVRIAAAWRSRF